MTILTAEGILVSWGLSPVDTTSIERSNFHKPSSNQAIRIVSVSCCTLCPNLDGPSVHVNERATQSGTTVVTLPNCTCKGPCPTLTFTGYDSVFVQIQQIVSFQLELLQDLIAVFFQISFVRCSILDPYFQIARHSVILLST